VTGTTELRVERDLIYALYANAPAVVVVGVAVGAMVLAAIWGSVSPAVLWSWVAVLVATQVARIWLVVAFRKEKPPEGPRIGVWAWRYALLLAATGATYGSTAIVMFPDATPLGQTVLMIVLGTLAASSITGYAYHPPGMALFILTSMLPLIGRLAFEEALAYKVLAFAFAFQAVTVLAVFGRVQAATLRRSVVFGHENAALVEELRVKTTLAEAAQRNAERASLAKSQFFAAASHDLRQPMQALGLYAASLREMKREPEDARKIDQILSSVDALDSLFDELLDISRLDAGYVEPVPTHFAARTLFDKLAATYAPIARDGGLSLDFRSGDLVLHSDAVLLERVLGNLIANALRYTEAGGVTVSCERREGCAVVVVEDTGIGIPEAEQERVFDEFYQLENPERDRRKGLGLGLATVRRITQLLGIPLKLDSKIGRGSRFTLELRLGEPGRVAQADAPRSAELDSLAGRRVLVIEDEASVREGLVELLRDWRCNVSAAPSAAEALPLLAQAPEAIVADYRLRDGRNGIEAIGELRQRFGSNLPALLVTGDTAPEIFLAARTHALPLLTKPVRAVRLRAALAHLFSGPGDSGHAAAQS
jgi:signal transduction histidine kinase/ActR/RegA family two-component response regulator